MKNLIIVTAISSITLLSGCASTTGGQGERTPQQYESEIKSQNQEIKELKQQLGSTTVASTGSSQTFGSDDLLPPNAKTGQCFARVYTPPTYRTESERVLKTEGYDVVSIIPAVYKTEEQTVMAEAETEVLEVVPAVYGWKEEQVLVSPQITELQRVPAKYEFQEERILVKPAHSIWKKGTGAITKIDQSTGEIMCLVEIPAVYKTVSKRALLSPETTKDVVVKEAVYKAVRTRVVEKPATTVAKKIPAVYGTVAVNKLVTAASSSSMEVPPTYETIETTIKVDDGFLQWAPVLCETNVTTDIIRELQITLNDKGYDAGLVDGIYGVETTAAVRKYQSDNSLAGKGQLTIGLIESLGVKY